MVIDLDVPSVNLSIFDGVMKKLPCIFGIALFISGCATLEDLSQTELPKLSVNSTPRNQSKIDEFGYKKAFPPGNPFVSIYKKLDALVKSPALSAKLGREQSDVLSFYVGEIKRKVFEKWKNPLGSKNDEAMALVTFRIFKKGNIDKPFIKKSTGNEKLDSLAVQAILDTEPFPALPDELKIPNLHISVQFKYIPEK